MALFCRRDARSLHDCAERFIDSTALVFKVARRAIFLVTTNLLDCIYASCLDTLLLFNRLFDFFLDVVFLFDILLF